MLPSQYLCEAAQNGVTQVFGEYFYEDGVCAIGVMLKANGETSFRGWVPEAVDLLRSKDPDLDILGHWVTEEETVVLGIPMEGRRLSAVIVDWNDQHHVPFQVICERLQKGGF
jgi:hypothetical protein